MKTTRTEFPKIYKAVANGRTFWIDGYTGEWKVSEGPSHDEADWWDTFPTKRDAVQYIEDRF